MSKIILIETSTALCSAAIAEDGVVTAYRESSAPKAHASLTAVFIQEMLEERGLTLADCDAVCVSKGPGSYTGLRVGVSTAKGLCFGAAKPLIAVGTLDTLVAQAAEAAGQSPVIPSASTAIPSASTVIPSASTVIPSEVEGSPYRFIIPMIDARRMEVYSAVFEVTDASKAQNVIENDAHNVIASEAQNVIARSGAQNVIARSGATWQSPRQITETAPAIIDETSFAEYLEKGPCLFIGDGAGKCADVIKHPNAHFCQCWPKASSMLAPAMAALNAGQYEDVAYFEPFYLKEFVATVSKKKLF
ncbi:MAG: tRNA (adenosine(37)-N6)-threonylcarbamoyltransferase complex dimerization subunit type 1 TsaB [Bacteroidales bacterium]|nr:tRNA (adenosine(37)-N6)-threonylcarbamoyltransferase complex dimerization subunit type 1 TsaB [Bacteroidales bacterium]